MQNSLINEILCQITLNMTVSANLTCIMTRSRTNHYNFVGIYYFLIVIMQMNHTTNPLHKIHDKPFQLKMDEYRIEWDYKSDDHSIFPYVCVMSLVQQASVVHYLIRMSKFRLHLIMYNIQGKAPEKKSDIGEGAFGLVRTERSRDRIFVVKRQLFRSKPELEGWELANKLEIEAVVIEVAIAKICSLFEIGPQLDFSIGFDLLCYSDCTEFHMEQCQKASDELILRSRAVLEQNLQLLHSFQIIHKDIKPINIVYSPTLKKCVFIDFGLSQPLIQPPYLRSATFYEGTAGFIGPEIMRLRDIQGFGFANLYENDRYALDRSFQKCQERIRKLNKCQSDKYFNIPSNNGPLIEEDIAALVYEQSHPNSHMKNMLLEQPQKPQSEFSELNNHQFLKLLFKYASFNNPAVRKDTRSCWRYLNSNQLKQMFGVLERLRNSSAIIDAVSQLEDLIGFFGQETIQLYQRLKRNIYQIGSPQLFFTQSELSIKNKIRIYGFTQQCLEVCRNVQTTSFWKRIVAHIRKKPQSKKKQSKLFQNLNLKLDPDFVLEFTASNKKTLLNQSIGSPIDLLKPLMLGIHRPDRQKLVNKHKEQLKRFEVSDIKIAVQILFDFALGLFKSEIDQNSPIFHSFFSKLKSIRQGGQLNQEAFLKLLAYSSELLSLFFPKLVIKQLKPMIERLKPDQLLRFPLINYFLCYSYFALGYYGQFSEITRRLPGQIWKWYKINQHIRLMNRLIFQIEEQMLLSNFIKALQINRIWLYFGETKVYLLYLKKLCQNNFIGLMKFALVYNRLGFKRLSERIMNQAQTYLLQHNINAIQSLSVYLQNKLRVYAFYMDPTPFNSFFKKLISLSLFKDFGIYYRIAFNLWISWAELLLHQDKSVMRSQRCFYMSMHYGRHDWNIQPLVKYLKALITYGFFDAARLVVVSMFPFKKVCPRAGDYIILEGFLFEILMSCRCFKRAFKVARKIIEKTKEIHNCNREFVDFLTKCAQLCHYHHLPKKTIEYCEINKGLIESPKEMLQMQLIISKAEMLKGNYEIAKGILDTCLKRLDVGDKNLVRQVHYQLSLLFLLRKNGIAEAQKHLSIFKQDSNQKIDLCRYYFRRSQLNLAKGTQKHMQSSLKDALSAQSIIRPEIGTIIEPIKLKLHIGTIYLYLKNPQQALRYFRSAAKLSIGVICLYSPITAVAFAKVGQTLYEMGRTFFGAVYCRIAYGIFRKLKLKQCSAYRRSAAILRSHKSLPFVPFQVPLKQYFANIVPFLKRLTVEQHRQLYSVKRELSEILNGGKYDVQLAKCRLEIAMHLKLIGQYESAADLVGRIDILLAKSSHKRIQKHMVSFKELLKNTD